MDPDKIQLLKDEIEQKLPEVLSNLAEVFKKYGISETQSTTTVELKLAPTKLQSGDAPQDLEEQTLSRFSCSPERFATALRMDEESN